MSRGWPKYAVRVQLSARHCLFLSTFTMALLGLPIATPRSADFVMILPTWLVRMLKPFRLPDLITSCLPRLNWAHERRLSISDAGILNPVAGMSDLIASFCAEVRAVEVTLTLLGAANAEAFSSSIMSLSFLRPFLDFTASTGSSASSSSSDGSESIPEARRKRRMVLFLFLHSAHSSAFFPFSAQEPRSAPQSRSTSQQASSPCSAATWSGVLDAQSISSTYAPALHRRSIISGLPNMAALCRGAVCHLSVWFTSAPLSNRTSKGAIFPFSIALYNGVSYPKPSTLVFTPREMNFCAKRPESNSAA
mmetsp:Transcript_37581/g.58682  ORF Transcript_37581/g.58682 Transcript_37581/m.58682 type:complete len:307 (-) Transcript_37581:40-960(-)